MRYAHAAVAAFAIIVAVSTYGGTGSGNRLWVPAVCSFVAVRHLVMCVRRADRPISS